MKSFVLRHWLIVSLCLICTHIMGQEITIHSLILNQERKIKIFIPDNYSKSNLKYPTIYLFDGDVLFDYLVGLYKYNSDEYPPAIIVGVNQINRALELGVNSKFTSFFTDELVPMIDARYRSNSIRIAIGHSFGGAFVLSSCLKSEKINVILSISPTITQKEYNLINDFKIAYPGITAKNIYLGYADNDYENIIKGTKSFSDLIKKYPLKIKTHLDVYPNENHGSSILIGIRRGLDYVFKDWFLPDAKWEEITEKKDPSIFYNYYKNVPAYYKESIIPSESDYNQLGYYFLNNNQVSKAISVFKENMELYPYSSNVYDSLGEAFSKMKDNSKAIFYYKKAIAIETNSNNDSAQLEMINKHLSDAMKGKIE